MLDLTSDNNTLLGAPYWLPGFSRPTSKNGGVIDLLPCTARELGLPVKNKNNGEPVIDGPHNPNINWRFTSGDGY